MTKSSDISARFWNLPDRAELEAAREATYIDDIISKAHIEREILANLSGVETVFDGGAGCGRFSVPLAARGLKVTHFDISGVMIDKARELADRAGALDNMTFVQGTLEDLSAFRDGQFDLVLSFDAPISYTYPRHERVIGELVRLAAKRILVSVYSRLSWTYLFDPAQKYPYILDDRTQDPYARRVLDCAAAWRSGYRPDMDAVRAFFRTGLMEPPEATEAAYDRGDAPWPVSYAFMPEELEGALRRHGARNIRLAGPGALSRSIPREVLGNIMRDGELKADFLDFCYWYDSRPACAGMGKDNLLARADVGPAWPG